jgi:hypothetical protein
MLFVLMKSTIISYHFVAKSKFENNSKLMYQCRETNLLNKLILTDICKKIQFFRNKKK